MPALTDMALSLGYGAHRSMETGLAPVGHLPITTNLSPTHTSVGTLQTMPFGTTAPRPSTSDGSASSGMSAGPPVWLFLTDLILLPRPLWFSSAGERSSSLVTGLSSCDPLPLRRLSVESRTHLLVSANLNF